MDNDERAPLRYIVNTADGAASWVDLMRGWVLLPNREKLLKPAVRRLLKTPMVGVVPSPRTQYQFGPPPQVAPKMTGVRQLATRLLWSCLFSNGWLRGTPRKPHLSEEP